MEELKNNLLDKKVLMSIREQKLTENQIKKKYERIYPPNIYPSLNSFGGYKREIRKVSIFQEVDVGKIIISLIQKGLLEEEILKSGIKTGFYFITNRGRGLIKRKEKGKI